MLSLTHSQALLLTVVALFLTIGGVQSRPEQFQVVQYKCKKDQREFDCTSLHDIAGGEDFNRMGIEKFVGPTIDSSGSTQQNPNCQLEVLSFDVASKEIKFKLSGQSNSKDLGFRYKVLDADAVAVIKPDGVLIFAVSETAFAAASEDHQISAICGKNQVGMYVAKKLTKSQIMASMQTAGGSNSNQDQESEDSESEDSESEQTGEGKASLPNGDLKKVIQDWSNGGAQKQAALEKYGDIADWDMSKVTNFDNVFYDEGNLNADISKWDTSSVTTMVASTSFYLDNFF